MKFREIGARGIGAGVAAILSLGMAGCGFVFSHAPPNGHEQMEYFSCTESNAGPILDIVWAALNVLGAAGAASDPDAYDNPGQIEAVGLGWGVLSTAAAITGFNKSKKCRLAKQQLAIRQAQSRAVSAPTLADPGPVQAVVITPAVDTLTIGERRQLLATAHNSSGAEITRSQFKWSSSNDAIASVNNAGLVTANAAGTVVIAANTANVVGTATLVIVNRR